MQWQDKEIDNGKIGEPIEILCTEYLSLNFGPDSVTRYPGRFPSDLGNTFPDILVSQSHSHHRIYIDTTVSPFSSHPFFERDSKSEQRRIFSDLDVKSDRIYGLIVYQQIIMLPTGYGLIAEIIQEILKDRITTISAQSKIDIFCNNYPYKIYNAFHQDWEAVANNLRPALGI